MSFAAFLQMEQVELARQQAQYATDRQLTEDMVLSAKIGAYMTENGGAGTLADADARRLAKDIREGNAAHLKDYLAQMSNDADATRAAQA